MAKSKKDADNRTKMIKFSVTEAEQREIRMGAASSNKSMADFAREVTLKAAKVASK